MDEHHIAKGAMSWPSHARQQRSTYAWTTHATVDEVDNMPHSSQPLLQSPLKPHSLERNYVYPLVHDGQSHNQFALNSTEKRPNALHAAAGCLDSLDRCAVGQVCLDGLCGSTHLASCNTLGILPPLSHGASQTMRILQPDSVNASAPAMRETGHQQPTACQDTVSRYPPGNPLDFAFLDAPTMPAIPGGSPSHNPWSNQAEVVALDDPLMHPLPYINGTIPASPTPRLSLSLSASGHSDSHSPRHQAPHLESTSGGFLPSGANTGASHAATRSVGASHPDLGDCLTTSVPHTMYRSVERPSHMPHDMDPGMVPVYMRRSVSSQHREVHSNIVSCSERDSVQQHGLESMSQPAPSEMQHVQPAGDTTAGIIGSTGMIGISCSATQVAVARGGSSAADAFDNSFSGFHFMDDRPAASSFDLSQNTVHTRALPISREHSLRMLHSTLCNVGASERGMLDLGLAGHEMSNGDMRPPAAPHRSSHFKPVMIPSHPAHLLTSFPSRPASTLLQPLSSEGGRCPMERMMLPAPHASTSNTQWHAMHNLPLKSALLSEGDASLDSSMFSMQRKYAEDVSTPLIPVVSHETHKPLADAPTIPLCIPGIQHPHQSDSSFLGRGLYAASAPGRMPLHSTATQSGFKIQHGEDVDTFFGGGDCMHECTVRGGRALQAQLLMDQGGSAFRPVMLRATSAGRSAPRQNGNSLDGRSKRNAKTLSEMVAAADAVPVPDGNYRTNHSCKVTDTSLHSSSKRTRMSTEPMLIAEPSKNDGPATSSHTGHTTGLTGSLDQFHVSEIGGSTQGGRSRRTRLGLDPKEEHSLEDWVTLIAREECAGHNTDEAHLREEFLHWETRSKCAPNGKWRGANSRKWGKVGIEMRLTGSVPRTKGPQTLLGKMVCKFVDVVELQECGAGISRGRVQDCVHEDSINRKSQDGSQYLWRLVEVVDKQGGGVKTVLKEKVWLGTYHTPINAAVHHDFYKVVLAVEGCIYTSIDIPACSAPTGKKKSQKLKLNFPLADLPELMYKAVRFTQLWNKYKQDAERYVFRTYEPEAVRCLVQHLIDAHCGELRKHVANNDAEGTVGTVERRSTRTRSTVPQQDQVDSADLGLD